MGFDSEDFKEFAAEARELIANAEVALLGIESGGSFAAGYDVIFRAFHNLKGGAGMMELGELQTHTHELETILTSFKDAVSLPKEYVTFFLRGIDGARSLLDGVSISFSYVVGEAVTSVAATPLSLVPEAAVVPEATAAATNPVQLAEATPLDGAAAEFFSECEEIIERVSANLQKIEANFYTSDTVAELYRDFHSLKGTAYLFSFNSLGDIAHVIESSLENVRNETHLPSAALVDGIFRSIKAIELEIECLKSGAAIDKTKDILPVLTELLSSIVKKLEPKKSATLMAAASVDTSTEVSDEQNFNRLAELTLAELKPAPSVPQNQPEKNLMIQKVEEKQPEKTVSAPAAVESEASSIRVSVSLLDNLMTLMGEMVLVRNQVLQYSNRTEDLEFTNLSKRLNVVTNEIQDEMMKTRMQPIGNILSKFNRVVRDLSQELHKNITLNLSGADTELDKSLLEAIKDPLTHIVRNSCDHGVETPEVRKQSGKSENGTISIKSFHEGGQVVIEVADDGKGLSKEVLLKKGLEKGLITEAQAKQMNEKEIFGLIFAPGFSTAQKVTNVSGRGVGMDVVRTNIEKIGGTVELLSVQGKGTTIRIKIPLTLAIIPALIVHSGAGMFAIPQVKLIELVRVDQAAEENQIEYLHGIPVFRLRGNILPLVDLSQVLGSTENRSLQNSIVNIAVLNADHCSFGLILDEVQDTADIVVKPLNRLLKSLQIYSGATILGDGSVALILDVLGLSKVANMGREEDAADQNSLMNELMNQRKLLADHQDYILVKVNSPTKHAIVLGYVKRLEEFKRSEVEYSGRQRVIRYRDAILPLISVNEQLQYTGATESTAETFPVIVVERAGVSFGIEVDEILDTLTSDVHPDTSFVRQAGIFGNLNTKEELVVVIDPFEVISAAFPEFKPLPRAEQKFAPAAGPLRILLAEDTAFFRKSIAAVLEKAGHTVTLSCDGQEAFEAFSKNATQFDLIVSDIEMPRMNGFALAKAIRAHTQNGSVPMLAISSRADPAYVSEGAKAGFSLYLEKLKPEILLNAVNELTGKGRVAA